VAVRRSAPRVLQNSRCYTGCARATLPATRACGGRSRFALQILLDTWPFGPAGRGFFITPREHQVAVRRSAPRVLQNSRCYTGCARAPLPATRACGGRSRFALQILLDTWPFGAPRRGFYKILDTTPVTHGRHRRPQSLRAAGTSS